MSSQSQHFADEILTSVIRGTIQDPEAEELIDILHNEGFGGREELPAIGERKARQIAKEIAAERFAWLQQQKLEGTR